MPGAGRRGPGLSGRGWARVSSLYLDLAARAPYAFPVLTALARARVNGKSRRKDGLLTTGDMARLSGSTLRTVRFYEEAGLLNPVQRTDGGHRLFEQPELDRLRLVTDLRAAGLALEEIREILESKARAPNGAQAACSLIGRLDSQLEQMRVRVKLLSRLVEQLDEARTTLECCQGCVNNVNFPAACGECKTLEHVDPVPPAVGVLWDLHR